MDSMEDVTVGLGELARFLRCGNEQFWPDIYIDDDSELYPILLPAFEMGA